MSRLFFERFFHMTLLACGLVLASACCGLSELRTPAASPIARFTLFRNDAQM
jgi:hypothetical protein